MYYAANFRCGPRLSSCGRTKLPLTSVDVLKIQLLVTTHRQLLTTFCCGPGLSNLTAKGPSVGSDGSASHRYTTPQPPSPTLSA